MSSQLVCRSLHRRWKEETLICLISTGCWNICAGVLICALATIMQNTSLPLIGQSFFFSSYKKKHFNAKFHCLLNWYKCRTLRSKQTIQNHRTKCALFMPTCNSFFIINSEWFFQELHASPQVTLEMNVELNIKITDQLLIQNQMYCECL